MSRKPKADDVAARLARDLQGPLNVAVGFRGAGTADCPFSVSGGTHPDDVLEEVEILLSAIVATLEAVAERCGNEGDAIGGCVFMAHASVAMIESVRRADKP